MKKNTIAYIEELVAQLHHVATHAAAVASLVQEFEPLVKSLAQQYWRPVPGAEIDDLEQEARKGLLAACESFDRQKGAFPSHAAWRIRRELANYIRSLGNPVRLPWQLMAQLVRLRTVEAKLANVLKREPTVTEMSEAMELPTATIANMLTYLAGPIELDTSHPDGCTPEEWLILEEEAAARSVQRKETR